MHINSTQAEVGVDLLRLLPVFMAHHSLACNSNVQVYCATLAPYSHTPRLRATAPWDTPPSSRRTMRRIDTLNYGLISQCWLHSL